MMRKQILWNSDWLFARGDTPEKATPATLPEALKKAYAAADCIHFDKLHRRSDIGARALAAMKAQEG